MIQSLFLYALATLTTTSSIDNEVNWQDSSKLLVIHFVSDQNTDLYYAYSWNSNEFRRFTFQEVRADLRYSTIEQIQTFDDFMDEIKKYSFEFDDNVLVKRDDKFFIANFSQSLGTSASTDNTITFRIGFSGASPNYLVINKHNLFLNTLYKYESHEFW